MQQSPFSAPNVTVICLFHWGAGLSGIGMIAVQVVYMYMNMCNVSNCAIKFSNQITYNEQCNIYMYIFNVYNSYTFFSLFQGFQNYG